MKQHCGCILGSCYGWKVRVCFDAVIGLNGALFQHGYEHIGEHEQGLLQVLIRTLQAGRVRFWVVEMSQGDGVRHVGQLRQVLGRFVAAEEVDEPGEFLRFDGVEVDHEDDG